MAPTPHDPASPAPRRRRPWPWLLAWMLPALVVALFGFGLGAYLYLVISGGTFTGTREVDRPAQDGSPSFSWNLRLTDRVTVLLIGTDITLDHRRRIVPVARADTLLLAVFDPGRDRISVLSIPRDTRAHIPGVGTMKINAAYAFGGPGLTIRTVEELLGVRVDYYVKLGPQSFVKLVDAIGGVEVDVEKDMKYTDTWAGLYIDLKKGRQVLNGRQAEGYIRFRKDATGDIGRVERQQKLLLALFRKLKQPAMVLRAPQLLRAFTENTQTNLTVGELITLALFASRLEPADIHTATLPGTFAPQYWEPDWPRVRQVVTSMFYGVDPEVLAATRVEVLNGSGIPGAARRTAARLQQLGFHVVRVGTAPQRAEETVVFDRSGRREVARLLADLLGKALVTTGASADGVDITVLLARDYSAHR